jgi:hypothetical protein
MPWPRGRPTTWNERLGDDVPCPASHVGEFSRGRDGRRKCRACGRHRMRRKRAAIAAVGRRELAA